MGNAVSLQLRRHFAMLMIGGRKPGGYGIVKRDKRTLFRVWSQPTNPPADVISRKEAIPPADPEMEADICTHHLKKSRIYLPLKEIPGLLPE
jgi:hypothetical protein